MLIHSFQLLHISFDDMIFLNLKDEVLLRLCSDMKHREKNVCYITATPPIKSSRPFTFPQVTYSENKSVESVDQRF